MSDKTLYDVLEVGRDAAPECIRAAYLHLSSRLRVSAALDADELRVRRLALDEAYFILINTERRRKYDEGLRLKDLQALASSYDPPALFPHALVLTTLVLAGGLYLYFDRVEEAGRRRFAENTAAQRRADATMEEARAQRERIAQQGYVPSGAQPGGEGLALPPADASR
jgi:hypothetical protein